MREFTNHEAKRLIEEMRARYGEQFDKRWAKVKPEVLENTICNVLHGLTPAEIRHGFDRMNREAWAPSIPEFRLWCEQGGLWKTANEAWIDALEFASDPKAKISVQAKEAYDKVRQVLSQEGQKAAATAFRDVYTRIIGDCKAKGEYQAEYVAPAAIEHVESTGKRAPMPADVRAALAGFVAKARA